MHGLQHFTSDYRKIDFKHLQAFLGYVHNSFAL